MNKFAWRFWRAWLAIHILVWGFLLWLGNKLGPGTATSTAAGTYLAVMAVIALGFFLADVALIAYHTLRIKDDLGLLSFFVYPRVIFDFWKKGLGWGSLRRHADLMNQKISLGQEMFRRAQEEAPESAGEIRRLVRSWKLEEARWLFGAAIGEARTKRERRKNLLALAEQYHCFSAVKEALEDGSEAEAELTVRTNSSLLDEAFHLNIWSEVAGALDRRDFQAARELITAAKQKEERNDLESRLSKRIQNAPAEFRGTLREKMEELQGHEFGSREFRKVLHALSTELSRAEDFASGKKRNHNHV